MGSSQDQWGKCGPEQRHQFLVGLDRFQLELGQAIQFLSGARQEEVKEMTK